MGIEIERKFLLASDGWRGQVASSTRIAQGYLNDLRSVREGGQKASTRVRIAADKAWLNIKSAERGAARQEFEYAIPLADAEALLQLCVGGLVEKIRHHVRHAGFLWEIDEFSGANAGLIVAEIELPAADTPFEKPAWAGRDVTDALRYYNLALTERPYVAWTSEEKG